MNVTFKPKAGLSEIYSVGLEMSLLDEQGNGLHPPVLCKDFLTDVFYSEAVNKEVSIYGFKWTPAVIPAVLEDTLHIGLRFKDEEIGTKIEAVKQFMNVFETALGFQHSITESTPDNKIIVIHFSKEWVQKPVLISLFTLLIRLSVGYSGQNVMDYLNQVKINGNPYGSRDRSYVSSAWHKLENILAGTWNVEQTFVQYETVSMAHNYGGILNYDFNR